MELISPSAASLRGEEGDKNVNANGQRPFGGGLGLLGHAVFKPISISRRSHHSMGA